MFSAPDRKKRNNKMKCDPLSHMVNAQCRPSLNPIYPKPTYEYMCLYENSSNQIMLTQLRKQSRNAPPTIQTTDTTHSTRPKYAVETRIPQCVDDTWLNNGQHTHTYSCSIVICILCLFPPVHPLIQVPNQLVGAPVGTDVTLVCNAEASPKAINYWQRENGEYRQTKGNNNWSEF